MKKNLQNLYQTPQFKIHSKSKPELKKSSKSEQLIYELKPVVTFALAIGALNSGLSNEMYAKFAATCLLLLTIYISLSRLIHRGHL